MNVLVTGGSGFVGRNLVEYLNPRYNVFAPSHTVLELLDSDAVNTYVVENDIDVIVHCANVGGSRKNNYDEGRVDVTLKNLQMFFNLSRCLTDDMRMLHMGSGAEYSRPHWRHKMGEDYFDCYVPEDAYGFSKYVMSKYIEEVDNITCLRLFGVYGKYEDYNYRFISNAIVKNLLHMPISINQNVVFDYLYINDLCRVVERFIKKQPKYKHINVTPTGSINLKAVAACVNRVSDFRCDIKVLKEGLNTEYTGDNSRLLEEIPGFMFTPYSEGIRELYEYYKTKKDILCLS